MNNRANYSKVNKKRYNTNNINPNASFENNTHIQMYIFPNS
jgi:hypothetical protein